MKEIAKDLEQVKGTQNAEIKPGSYTTFLGQEGRNYILSLTDMDGDYPATISVFDMDWGHLVKKVKVEPFTATSVIVKMGKGNGIRVYNESPQPTKGRPAINASLYHA